MIAASLNDTGISRPYCVDIGAWDGKHLSNTFHLVHDLHWSGLLVEANSERCQDMLDLYADRDDVTCLDCLVDIAGPDSLLNLLKKHNVPIELEFLSIDVDGADYHLLASLLNSGNIASGSTGNSQRENNNNITCYRPKVICIEFNPTIPNHVYYVQAPDISIQEGSSRYLHSHSHSRLPYPLTRNYRQQPRLYPPRPFSVHVDDQHLTFDEYDFGTSHQPYLPEVANDCPETLASIFETKKCFTVCLVPTRRSQQG